MSLQLAVFENPLGRLMADLSADTQDLEFGTGPHGFTDLSCRALQRLFDRYRLYDRPGLPHVEVNWHGQRIWEGRLEDLSIRNRGLGVGAAGYWSALFDIPYTALWSSTGVDGFKPTLETDVSDRRPKLYTFDMNNRLFIGLTKNTAYTTSADVGELYSQAPNGGARQIVAASFDYEVLLPSNWKARFVVRPFGFGSSTVLWDHTANGTTQTGSHSISFSGTPGDMALFPIFNSTGATYTYTGENGANYLKITNLRVKTTTTSSVYADEIAAALVSYLNSINATQIQNVASFLESPALDLRDEVYEDEWPGDILDRLVRLGDNQAPPAQWEAAIWEDRILRLNSRGKYSRTWYIDVAAPDMERSIAALRNSAYAVYKEAGGRTLRTAVSTDADRVALHELTRRAAVPAQTTSTTQAQAHRDAYLADNAEAKARAEIEVPELYDAGGARYPAFLARSGDTVVIRNLPPTHSSEIDRRRAFRVSETRYSAGRRTIQLTPELPRPSLGVMLARRSAGVE